MGLGALRSMTRAKLLLNSLDSWSCSCCGSLDSGAAPSAASCALSCLIRGQGSGVMGQGQGQSKGSGSE